MHQDRATPGIETTLWRQENSFCGALFARRLRAGTCTDRRGAAAAPAARTRLSLQERVKLCAHGRQKTARPALASQLPGGSAPPGVPFPTLNATHGTPLANHYCSCFPVQSTIPESW